MDTNKNYPGKGGQGDRPIEERRAIAQRGGQATVAKKKMPHDRYVTKDQLEERLAAFKAELSQRESA